MFIGYVAYRGKMREQYKRLVENPERKRPCGRLSII
jgi:hypothetical protein